MVDSPLTKRQRLNLKDTTYNNVKSELEAVISLRKDMRAILEQIYSAETSELVGRLRRIEVNLRKIETYEVPDVEPIFQGFRTLSKEYDEMVPKIYEHIPLLKKLEQVKNCPIAKLIDDI